ncbi:hypothetical protein [Pedobacter cryoconitis]|uniref:Uncharacterized protein n=1 Tax=Pedobacter cryoconitis TaxID=188932 RepID=A0A7X0MLC3_9SPHI|nr:hypothetical protein [Pedobacter cryoconitis]MBB6501665.1 hypothetical protein [Pedobacter cryoconitis]
MANFWYAYNGVGDPTLSSSYSKITGAPGCLNGPTVCAIYVQGGTFPVSPLPANILQYIADGQAKSVAQPQLPVGSKFFVYLKS